MIYNQWSCGDYSENLNFNKRGSETCAIERTTEYSTNGRYSVKLTGDIWDWVSVKCYNLNLPCNNIQMKGDVKSSGDSRMVANAVYVDNTSEQFTVDFSEGETTPLITINSEKIIQTLELQFTLKHDNGTMFIDNIKILV